MHMYSRELVCIIICIVRKVLAPSYDIIIVHHHDDIVHQ